MYDVYTLSLKHLSSLIIMTRPISKSRFYEFVEHLENIGVRDVHLVIQAFCQVFDFDPDATTYDPKKGQQFIAWRRAKQQKNKNCHNESNHDV